MLCTIFTVYCACITYFKFTNGVCYSKKTLNGKTASITGGNKGIGYEIALGLAKSGARVLIACRNKYRASQAAESLRKQSKTRIFTTE